MDASQLSIATSGRTAAADSRRVGMQASAMYAGVHRYAPAIVHEMTPDEIEAQRRLVRASLLPRRV